MSNNNLGINSFSGPMGEKEPAYGAVERAKVLSAMAPVGSPAAMNAPKRAQRRAVKGKGGAQAVSAPPATPSPPGLAQSGTDYQTQLGAFWQSLAAEPDASDEVREYAARVANG